MRAPRLSCEQLCPPQPRPVGPWVRVAAGRLSRRGLDEGDHGLDVALAPAHQQGVRESEPLLFLAARRDRPFEAGDRAVGQRRPHVALAREEVRLARDGGLGGQDAVGVGDEARAQRSARWASGHQDRGARWGLARMRRRRERCQHGPQKQRDPGWRHGYPGPTRRPRHPEAPAAGAPIRSRNVRSSVESPAEGTPQS